MPTGLRASGPSKFLRPVAGAHQFLSVANRHSGSGPDQVLAFPVFCFLKSLQLCKFCLSHIFQTETRNKKYFILKFIRKMCRIWIWHSYTCLHLA
jgi:hypothetical protein